MFHRIVHLDLKGAPWQVSYLGRVIPLFKKWGATGVLLEWEDTFPYTGELMSIGSLGGCSREGLYSREEVVYIMQCIKDHGMEPIQLVQTLGHMEFVLKHGQFKCLRELSRSPAVLCPSQPQAKGLCKNMLRQLLDVQPGARFIHIGADEAWHMNVCVDCQRKSHSHEEKVESLFLDHIRAMAAFVKAWYPDVTVLMWDDMIRPMAVETLKAYDLGKLVQPVVWNYACSLQIDIHLWEKYAEVFPNVWVGSAFKGANGSCQMLCDVGRYASNQAAWQEELNIYEGEICFGGVILTGWSRFDHYATLCELLPLALPSLASCLKMWTKPEGATNDMVISNTLPIEECPGHELVNAVISFASLRERCLMFLHGDQIETWFNEWQVERGHTSPLQVENIAANAKQLVHELTMSRRAVLTALTALTGSRSAEEFTRRVTSLLARVSAIALAADNATLKSETGQPCD